MSARSGELVVVKLGGTTLAEQRAVLDAVAARAAHDRVVLVHGGGKRLTEWLSRMGVESHFEGGLRVTDDAALEVALAVLRGVINAELVSVLRAAGADAVGLSGVDGGLLISERIPTLGRVATVTGARGALLATLLDAGVLPVIAPLALDADGTICNVNADDAAAGLAGALGARLVLLTDTDGVRGADGQRIAAITDRECERLIDSGVISGGMVPKVRCALRALAWGAPEVVIADGATDDALGRALADPGFGTRARAAG
ncbi:MAG: acetylglutamate kinase [Chloroflexota bacterium]